MASPRSKPPRFNEEATRHIRAGQALEGAGRLREAAGAYQKAAEAQPRSAPILIKLGQLLRDIGFVERAEETLRRAARLDPRSGAAQIELALVHVVRGEHEPAMECYTRASWLDRRSAYPRIGKADLLERLGKMDEAIAEADAALKIEPTNAYARVMRARLLARRGESAEARALLEGMLGEELADEVRYRAGFQLVRLLDRAGDREGAFEAARAANTAQARTAVARSVDQSAWLRKVEESGKLGKTLFERASERTAPDDGPAPVLIVGFPRSGTTMTEQLLSAHPLVAATNEADLTSPMAGALLEGLDQERPLRELLDGVTDERIAAARAAYRAAAAPHLAAKPGATVLVDKHPLNIVSLGMFNVVFPESRVIHAVRDPRDACLSCYFQDFASNVVNVSFFTLEGTLEMYRRVMGLFVSQRDVLTLDVLECRYEETVSGLEAQARRLLGFVGLEWDAGVLGFHEERHHRYVGTPSYEAITAPVHTRAMGRWKGYREQLGPILGGLEEYVRAFGYDEG